MLGIGQKSSFAVFLKIFTHIIFLKVYNLTSEESPEKDHEGERAPFFLQSLNPTLTFSLFYLISPHDHINRVVSNVWWNSNA